MDNAFTLAVLLLAVVCVMAATRPSRSPERPRQAPTDQPPAATAESPGKPRPRDPADADDPDPRSAAPRRWDRRDLARALAIDLVAPGAEGEFWPLGVER